MIPSPNRFALPCAGPFHTNVWLLRFIREPRKICGTSAKIIEYGCRDAPCEKSWQQGNPLGNTIKDTSTIMRNPSLHNSGKGLRMIVLVSLIILLRGFLVATIFHMVHPYIHIHSMNDFCTCVYRDKTDIHSR